MRYTIIALAALLLAGCHVTAQPEEAVAVPANTAEAHEEFPDLQPTQRQAMTVLLAACPGLTTYRDAWTLDTIREVRAGAPLQVTWKMQSPLYGVPSEYFASGQTCFANVGGDRADRVGITKRPCVRVCLDRAADVPTSTEIEIQ